MQTTLQDLRFALRQFLRAPGFAFTIIFTLALGIGSATAVFSVVDATLLRPLPFANQDRLVSPDTTARAGYTQPWSWLSYVDTRAQLKTFQALAGYTDFFKINLESPSGPVSLQAIRGTDNFFDVFGVAPILGRTFLPGEDQPGKDNVAVLSYKVWMTNFGGQKNVIGKVARLDAVPYTIIGVMPASFRFPLGERNTVYTPIHAPQNWKEHRGSHWMRAVGLLKPGVTRRQAQADFTSVLANIGRQYPETDGGRMVTIVPLQKQVVGTASGPVLTLLFAVLALLAIACVNVAGLLLARGVKREREVALRAAVGAGRGRLVRQMITESLVLSTAGLIGGVLLSWALLAAMRVFLVSAIARGQDVTLNLKVLLAALVLSAITSLAASLAPALRLSGTDPNKALRAGGAAGTGRGQHRVRSAFVVTQVALSLVLLVVSGLLLRTLHDLLNTNLGFNPNHILTTRISLSPGNYENRDPLTSLYQPLLDRVSHLHGVEAAGVVNLLPVQTYGSNEDVHITGQPPYPPEQQMLAEVRLVSSGYFDAMGIRNTGGRMLSAEIDTPDRKASSVVVNEAFRRKFFPAGGTPVGAHIDDSDKPEEKTGLVGTVSDVRQDLYNPPLAEMDYLVDEIAPKDRLGNLGSMALLVRTSGDPQQLAGPIREALRQIDPTIPFQTPETMSDVVSETLVFERMQNWLFGIFAGFALLLALVGLYGLTTHEVELRTRDIGIRMALGSTRGQVMRQILARVGRLMLVGVAAGWLITLAAQKGLASVVQIHPAKDATLLVALTLSLVVIGIGAALWPSRRAASINPIEALRAE
jgi:putative ABC transport system permease protein